MDDASFSGKTVMVTGAGSGIGRASARLFARKGANVGVVDVNIADGEETVRQIHANGGAACFIRADVSQDGEVRASVQQIVSRFGGLHCAHNNAGIEAVGPCIADCREDVWDRIIAVNLKGVWLCMKHQIAHMLQNGGGAIVNTASIAGLVGAPGGGAYSASKHGVVGLTKTAALEYVRSGIRINAICPGLVRTAMTERLASVDPTLVSRLEAETPIGRAADPAEIAAVVAWLCSDDASFVVGQAVAADGGAVAQ